jgi:hypothetical protein
MKTEIKLQTNKEWKTPELIVLIRSKPQQAILLSCRTSDLRSGSDYTYQYTCNTKPESACQLCHSSGSAS